MVGARSSTARSGRQISGCGTPLVAVSTTCSLLLNASQSIYLTYQRLYSGLGFPGSPKNQHVVEKNRSQGKVAENVGQKKA